MAGPLQGYKILDLSRILAGPWASQMLADLGAEVIKIERPHSGDDTRGWGPPYMPCSTGDQSTKSSDKTDAQTTTQAAYFHGANRGKQSVCIDMSQPQGQTLIRQLAEQCDVLIENFKVGGLAKYQLDYASLKKINPRLVYCSITGFGQTGPYAQRAGYDFMIQAMGGLMSVTGEADGQPMKVGVALADVMTGLYASNAIQAALIHQQRSGAGQHIDMALLDVQVATLANQSMNFLASGQSPTRLGNSHPNIVPYQAFACEGGHIILAIGNDSQFQNFCDLTKRPELGEDERFSTNSKRVENREILVPIIVHIMKAQKTAWWLDELNARGIPCGPINDIEQVFQDPQVKHRKMQIELDHPQLGKLASVANPINFSETEIEYELAAPMLGQHTKSVLMQKLGLTESQLKALRKGKVIN